MACEASYHHLDLFARAASVRGFAWQIFQATQHQARWQLPKICGRTLCRDQAGCQAAHFKRICSIFIVYENLVRK